MKKKKLLSILLASTMAVTALTGCGGGSSSDSGNSGSDKKDSKSSESSEAADGTESAEDEAVVSTYGDANGKKMDLWTFVDVHAEYYGKMVEAWNKANPDKTISLTATTYPYADMHDKLLMSLQSGSGAPDICDVEVGQIPNVVAGEENWLYPVDDAMKTYEKDMIKSRLDIYKGADGKQYGVPFHVGATVMYYNMKALEDAGLTQADVDKVETWDDYTELGKKYLKAIGNPDGKFFTSVDTGGTDWLWLAMAEYGEDWTGGIGGKANVQLKSVKKMLEMQKGWLDDKFAEVSPDGHVDLEAGFQNILDHNIVSFPKAMWYMSRFKNYMPEEKGNWYITKCPVFEKGQSCSVGIGGTGTVVTQQAEEKDLAAEFLTWAKCSPEGETAIWQDLGFDVCNTSLWTDDGFAHDKSNFYNTYFRNFPYDVLASIKDQIGKIAVTKISPTINEQICQTTLNDIFENGKSVDDALQEAQDAVDLEQE